MEKRRKFARALTRPLSAFAPIRRVGVAYSLGFPMLMMGVFILLIADTANDTRLFVAGGVIGGLGFIWSCSGRVV